MKRNFVVMAFSALILGICCMSCEKDDLSVTKSLPSSYSIRHFSSFEQLFSELEIVNNMSQEERTKYEAQMGYISFGNEASKIYDQLTNKFSDDLTEKDIQEYLKQHSDFLEIRAINGEEYVDVKYANSPFVFVMNQDRIVQIDTILIKVFENCHVTCHERHFDQLQQLTEAGLSKLDTSIFHRYDNYDHGNLHTTSFFSEKINNKERVTVEIKYVLSYYEYLSSEIITHGLFTIETKGWRKFLGRWWNVKRTLYNDIDANLNFTYTDHGWPISSITQTLYGGSHCTGSGKRLYKILCPATVSLSRYNCSIPSFYISSINGTVKTNYAELNIHQ